VIELVWLQVAKHAVTYLCLISYTLFICRMEEEDCEHVILSLFGDRNVGISGIIQHFVDGCESVLHKGICYVY